MHRTIDRHTLPAGKRRLPYIGILASILCILVAVTFASTTTTYAASRSASADPVRTAVNIAKPAVVRIFTTTTGSLVVHFSPTTNVTFPQGNGQVYQLQLSGSGTIISPTGDILTADHVVNPPAEVLDQAAGQNVADYINQNPKLGLGTMSADQVTQALQSGQLKSDATFNSTSSEVFLSTDYTGPLTATDLNSVPSQYHATVDKIEKQSAVDQRDVAIVHATFSAIPDLPNVQLGDSSNVQQQDQLTIIGFPGNGDVSTQPTDLLTSSVNQILVSSIKTTDTGAPVIQVGGNVEHGDSGGPALDSNGQVVGIVSFGLADPNSPGGTSFLQASNSARDLLQGLNLNTAPGPFEQQWSQALTDYSSSAAGHWHKAAQELGQIATKYPLFKAVNSYLTNAQTQAKTERVPQATPTTHPKQSSSPSLLPAGSTTALALTIGGVVVLVLLILVLFGVAVRQRKKKGAPVPQGPMQVQGNASPASMPKAPGPTSVTAAPPVQSAANLADAMSAFGAPPGRPQPVPPAQTLPNTPVRSLPTTPPTPAATPSGTFTTLRVWPCGHMNRPNARFCSICGEPAPPPPTVRRVEQ
jgi:serine protease Do